MISVKIAKIIVVCGLILMTSCSFNINKNEIEKVTENINKQIDVICEESKTLLSNLSFEKAEEILEGIMEKIPEDKKQIAYKGIEKGVKLLDDGKEVIANELQIDFSIEGAKEEIEKFLGELAKLNAKISIGDVKVEKTDDDYKLDCTINFYYNLDNKTHEGAFTTSFNKNTSK